MGRHVREAVSSMQTGRTPTTPPVLLTTQPLVQVAYGTKEGELMIVRFPFADGKQTAAHAERIPLETSEEVTVSNLFLDLEHAPAIISLIHDQDGLLIGTRGGNVWRIKKSRRRLISLESELAGVSVTDEGILIATGLKLILLARNGQVKDTLQLDAEALAAPLWLPEESLAIIPTERGVEAVSIFRGVLVKKWAYASAAVHATPAARRVREGILLITFGSHDGIFHALTSDGRLVWQYKTGGSILSQPRMDDLNGDGITDIIFGSTDDSLYVLDEYGVREWSYETDFWITARPAVYDINRDGLKELFVGSYDGILYTFSPQPDFVPAVNVAAASMLQQALLVDEEAHESVAGYFAKLLAREELGGMILSTEAWELNDRQGVIVALTHHGIAYAKRYTLEG